MLLSRDIDDCGEETCTKIVGVTTCRTARHLRRDMSATTLTRVCRRRVCIIWSLFRFIVTVGRAVIVVVEHEWHENEKRPRTTIVQGEMKVYHPSSNHLHGYQVTTDRGYMTLITMERGGS